MIFLCSPLIITYFQLYLRLRKIIKTLLCFFIFFIKDLNINDIVLKFGAWRMSVFATDRRYIAIIV